MKRILLLCGISIGILFLQSSYLPAETFNSTRKHLSILGSKTNIDNYIVQLSSPSETRKPAAEPQLKQVEAVVPPVTEQAQAGQELLDYLSGTDIFCFTNDKWICMRREKEGFASKEGGVAVSTMPRAAPPPLPPGLSVELPYESQLSISGRKTIGVALKVQRYDFPNPPSRTDPAPSFDMTQELQVKIKGKVGRKINVNVDFDDTTADRRDISVVYKGDPEEVVQEAAFGDISMSLPQTEFVGYSKQLFGVKLETKYKGLHSWGFFSQTKGFSEVKRFTGNTTLDRRQIPDTGYISLKYYGFKFNNDDVLNGSVKVYMDDRNQTNNNINTSTMTIESLTSPATYYTGNFDLLVPGQDYTVDYVKGIIIFRSKLVGNYIAAVDYQRADKTWLSASGTLNSPKIIKYDDSVYPALSKEMKTFYSLGNLKIIRDNGRGNFILRVVDLSDAAPATIEPGGKPVPAYPNNINVDFENGIFNIESADGKPFHDDLYSKNTHAYNILTEYSYRIKFIILRPGIVPKSEKVTMDGRILKANEDYFIDYDAGLVTFFNEEKITESTVIEISYDYAPFGGTGGSTLVGLRNELSLTKNIFIGSSYIYQMDARTQSVPDIRTTPTSLAVMEADSRITDIKIPFTPLQMSIGAEYAQSQRNPNITDKGRAVVESMEGIKQEDSVSINYQSWHPASNPSGIPYYAADVSLSNETVSKADITKNLQSENNEQVQVLNVSYNLSRSNELSIVQSLSTVGLDFSRKIYAEMWIWGDGGGAELSIGYGQFNENSDGDDITTPKTEDLNHDGTLNQGEDIGWPFKNPDGTKTAIGPSNGIIDTQDLDNNGILNTYDLIAYPGPYGAESTKGLTDTSGVVHTSVDWNGWKYFTVPLNIANPDDWKTIKQVRITLRKVNGTQLLNDPKIKIYSLAAISNKWETAGTLTNGTTLAITALDRNSNEYVNNSLVFNNTYRDLYAITSDDDILSRNEQTLALKYNTVSSTGDTVAAKEVFTRAYDISNYKEFHIFVYSKDNSGSDTFFLQAGNDANYYEYSIPVKWLGWKEITIHQFDVDGKDKKPETWAVTANGETSSLDGAMTRVVGTPSFLNITQFKTGVRTNGPRTNGEIWVNEMFVATPYIKTGEAKKVNMDFKLPRWADFGVKRKTVDRNFETFSAGVYNRDSLDESGYFNLSRISFMPVSTRLDHGVVVTPAVVQTQNNLVSLLEEGKVITYNGSVNASLNLAGALPTVGRLLPVFGGSYSKVITDTRQLKRLEDNETKAATMEYAFPVRFALFPTNISANYSVTDSYFRVYPSSDIPDSSEFLDPQAFYKYLGLSKEPGYRIDNYHTLDITKNWGVRAPFQVFSWFNFSPSYSYGEVRENNRDFPEEFEYYKNRSQNVGASSALRLVKWFQPNLNYVFNIKETYSAVYSTTPYLVNGSSVTSYPGENKFIERTGAGEINWNFQVKDIFDYKYTRSLGFSSSYRIQDSDSYDNVISSFSTLGLTNQRLWLRGNPLTKEIAEFQSSSFTVNSQIYKDDVRFSGRYNPFEAFDFYGRLSAIKTMSTNLTYTQSQEDSTIMGTNKQTTTKVWPDMLIGLGQIEKITWLERWVSDSHLNLKNQVKHTLTLGYTEGNTTTYGGDIRFMLVKRLDMSFSATTALDNQRDLIQKVTTLSGRNASWSGQSGINLKLWRLTLRYDNSINNQKDGTDKLTTDLLTDTYTAQVYSDMSFPKGLPIPFTNKKLNLTNRIIFNTTLKHIVKTSSLNVSRDNTNTSSLATSAEYEVSQNFRLSVGLGFTRMDNRAAKGTDNDSYTAYEANSRLTIQF